jgi:hypothetical protein
MRRNSAKFVALGGVMAALAVVVMAMGTLIPVATFVCPMVCIVLLTVVLRMTNRRISWAWYGAVSILSLLLAPDKEAAAVFLFFGYYPIVKPWFDRRAVSVLWKLVLFNVSIFIMYGILIWVFGLKDLLEDYQEMGMVLTAVTLLLGNATLFMMDVLLGRMEYRRRG